MLTYRSAKLKLADRLTAKCTCIFLLLLNSRPPLILLCRDRGLRHRFTVGIARRWIAYGRRNSTSDAMIVLSVSQHMWSAGCYTFYDSVWKESREYVPELRNYRRDWIIIGKVYIHTVSSEKERERKIAISLKNDA